MDPQKKLARLLAQAAELTGKPVEEYEDLIEKPTESTEDYLRDAESVYHYFEVRGQGFKEKECRNCHKIFAYKWDVDFISYCSIQCAKESLEKIGLTWNPEKPHGERWGIRNGKITLPMRLSPDALEAVNTSMKMNKNGDALEDQISDRSGEQHDE